MSVFCSLEVSLELQRVRWGLSDTAILSPVFGVRLGAC